MAIESIRTNAIDNSNIVQSSFNNNSVVTESIDLEAMALNAYNQELSKYQTKLDSAQTMFDNARLELEGYKASAASLSSGTVKTTISYDQNGLNNLMKSALEQLSSDIPKYK